MRRYLRAMLPALAILCSVGHLRAAEPAAVQTFTLTERFGVSHPDQVLDFDLDKPVEAGTSRLLDANGQEVAYQLLEGGKKLAVRTDLPAGETLTWRLMPGKPAARVADAVVVAEVDGNYEITNGLTGLRVPRAVPVNDVKTIPAPVQGVRYRDGAWTATGPNLLSVQADAVHKMEVRFLERGPLVTTVEVSYSFDRPATWHPDIRDRGREAGPGFYRSTITLQAGQPSVLFEEDTDMDLSYSLNCYPGLEPTNGRYRGHSSNAKEYGYEADGRVYRPVNQRPPSDAFVDLQYDRPQRSDMFSTPESWARMVVWSPWWAGSGQYWMLYNREAPETANLVGIFAGRASRALGAASSGTGIYTLPGADGAPAAGLTVTCGRWCPNTTFSPHIRYQWGLFVSTKRDLLAPDTVQPIARQMNLHGGINLNKIHRWTADFPDPPGGYGAMYVKPEVIQGLRVRMRDDDAFYRRMYAEFPLARDLYDIWHDATGAKAQKAVADTAELARTMLDAYVNADGIYHFRYHYWHGGLAMQHQGEIIAQVLDEPAGTAEERARVKATAALFANILWDDDFVPLFTEHQLNLGNANMPMQQAGYREFYALLLAAHPMMKDRVAAMREGMIAKVRHLLNEYGAQFSSTGYQHASMMSTLGTLARLQRLGLLDAYREEPRLAKYGEFYMDLLTPPDPRFGKGWRQLIKVGDESINRGSHLTAMLAAGLAESRPELSARLMGAWQSLGSPYDDFFGASVLRVDDALPAADMALTSADFPGYYSVLRSGYGTPDETAVWFVNGDFLQDHRHADMGDLVIWALGAPLSVDMGTNYSPALSGATLHSVSLPESALGRAWTAEQKDINECRWIATGPERTDFCAFRLSAAAGTTFRNPGWRRAVRLVHGNPALPVIVVEDRFTGDKPEPWVLHFNLMAEGEVGTPAGAYTPLPHVYSAQNFPDRPKEVPSVGPTFPLAAGPNQLSFAGPRWGTPEAPQASIDWDLYTVSTQPQEAYIGNWAHEGIAWGGPEFQQTNGRPFEERQHLLRVRGSGGFTTLILPYRKGEPPAGRTVIEQDGVLRIAWRDEETFVGPNWQAFRSGDVLTMLALLDPGQAEYRGLTVAGGPTEVVLDNAAHTVAVTAHGAAGRRTLALPGQWQASERLQRVGNTWTLDYKGGDPVTLILSAAKR